MSSGEEPPSDLPAAHARQIPPPVRPANPDRAMLAETQRQSPLAIIFSILRLLRSVGIFQIVIGALFLARFLARGGLSGAMLALVPIPGLVLVAVAVLSWWRFTFRIEGDELKVTKGVLAQDRLSVPLDRVQSVSIDQRLLHRFMGLVRVSVETAGAAAPEFTIDGVTRPVALALQRVAADYVRPSESLSQAGADHTQPADELAAIDPGLSATSSHATGPATTSPATTSSATAAPTAADVELFTHPPGRLILFALASVPSTSLLLIGPLVGLSDDIADLIPFSIPVPDQPSGFGLWLFWFMPLAALAAMAAAVILNVIRVLLTDWQLTLTRTPAGLRRTAGLLSKTSRAASLDRTQLFRTRQNPAQRRLGLRELKITSVGVGSGFTLPACDDAQTTTVRDLALGRANAVASPQRWVSPASVFLEVRNRGVVVALVVAALFLPFGWPVLAILLLIPLSWLVARRRHRRFRWDINEAAIATRSELVAANTTDMLWRKINHVQVSQTFFERRRNLATVRLSAASGAMEIGMIPLEEAWALRDKALAMVETDVHSWM